MLTHPEDGSGPLSDMAACSVKCHQPEERCLHSTHIVGDYLYMWGGQTNDLLKHPYPNANLVDILDLQTGVWETKRTEGSPPLGVIGYASTVFDSSIVYFGGYTTNNSKCSQNSLQALSVHSLIWKKFNIANAYSGPTGGYCRMVTMKAEQMRCLVVIGSTTKGSDEYLLEELHYFDLSNNHWFSPEVHGERPISCHGFTLSSVKENSAVLFGGKNRHGSIDQMHIANFHRKSVQWQKLTRPIHLAVISPKRRWGHASVFITKYTLLVVGGAVDMDEISGSWLWSSTANEWKTISLPESVTKRWNHSLSSYQITKERVLVFVFGGLRNVLGAPINETTVIELAYTGQEWTMMKVCNHPLTNYKDEFFIEKTKACRNSEPIVPPQNLSGIDSILPWKRYQMDLRQKLYIHQQHEQQLTEDAYRIEQTLYEQLQTSLEISRKLHLANIQLKDENRDLLQHSKCMKGDLEKAERHIVKLEEGKQSLFLQNQEMEKLLQDTSNELQVMEQQNITLEQNVKTAEESVVFLESQLKQFEERESQFKKSEEKETCFLQQIQDVTSTLEQTMNSLEERTHQLQLTKEQAKESEMKLCEATSNLKHTKKALEDRIVELEKQIEHKRNVENELQEQLREIVSSSHRECQQLKTANDALQRDIELLKVDCSWVVKAEEIQLTSEPLGEGGWGIVSVANFRGTRVAAKCLHKLIISHYNISIFTREMDIAARLRHPNIVQLIAATLPTQRKNPIILSELMPTSLRKELERSPLNRTQVLKIAHDVCKGLNYLHLWKPYAIIHRDISSSNVLLEPSCGDQWKGKLSDFGSANVAHKISTTIQPGCPAYAAPEASVPDKHTPAMDVYSFGVMLMEMVLCEFPASTSTEREEKAKTIDWAPVKSIIQKCIHHKYQSRPQMAKVIDDLQCNF